MSGKSTCRLILDWDTSGFRRSAVASVGRINDSDTDIDLWVDRDYDQDGEACIMAIECGDLLVTLGECRGVEAGMKVMEYQALPALRELVASLEARVSRA